MKLIVYLTILVLCLTAVTSQRVSSCCLNTRGRKIPKTNVEDYRIQKAGICPIDAIVLLTKNGKRKCYDANSDPDWIIEIMTMVDKKKPAAAKEDSDPKDRIPRQRIPKRRKGHGKRKQKRQK